MAPRKLQSDPEPVDARYGGKWIAWDDNAVNIVASGGFLRAVRCLAAAFTILAWIATSCLAQANSPGTPPLLYTTPLEEISADTPRIKPWKSISLDPLYKGMWVVAGDLDGDGEVELVSARIHDVGDVHYTASVVVHKLDGSVLWRWGQPDQGVFPLHSDVACQIYDWDDDGKNEVIVAAERAVVEIDGATGIEKRRFAIPQDASDCIVFCNLTGGPRATDILVKTRYSQIWAFDRAGQQLWTYKCPGAYRTAHQPRPIDVDGDGRDEIMAGFLMLNHDGSERWALHEGDPSLARWKPLVAGHLDCARLLSRGVTPAESTIALTFCGAERIALVRGTGDVIWSVYGKHFESIDVGKVCRSVDGRQLVVDIPYAPRGNQPLWILDERGTLLGEIIADYSRIHRLVDWHGEGVESIVVGSPPTLYDGETGRRLAIFDMPNGRVQTRSKEVVPYICSTGDMTGDGRADVLFLDCATGIVHVYRNERGRPSQEPRTLGTGVNWTLY